MSLPYTNPANIALALGVLLMTVRLKPKCNQIINWVGASTFAVYLCHMCNTWTATLYKNISLLIYREYSGFMYLCIIFIFMSSVFIFSISYDQFRKLIWKAITPLPIKHLYTYISTKQSRRHIILNEFINAKSRNFDLSWCA